MLGCKKTAILSGVLVVLMTAVYAQPTKKPLVDQLRQPGFFYTYPLLDFDLNNSFTTPIKAEVTAFVNAKLKEEGIDRVSVYFRQLKNGYSFGINENDKFNPASMLKVSNMIYVLKKADTDATLLGKKVLYDEYYSIPDNSDPDKHRLKLGKEYTIAELINEMILFSDNEAMELLKDHFGEQKMWKSVFTDLEMHFNTQAGIVNMMSPKDYSVLFRLLYNCTYLSREMSLKALDLLCRTSYKEGIVKGVDDESIPIASKYGFRKLKNNLQLHESGIVYYEGQPYYISVMTKGSDKKKLSEVIAGVSGIVHENYERHLEAMDKYIQEKTYPGTYRMTRNEEYRLISPLLDCRFSSPEMAPLKQKISNFINDQKGKGNAKEVTVYLKLLNSGEWLTINPDVKYSAASLIKVPHMIGLMRQAQRHLESLYQELEFKEQHTDAIPEIVDEEIIIGQKYSVLDLIRRMIVYSDNQAASLLFTNIADEEKIWGKLFFELGMSDQMEQLMNIENSMTAEQVALFFNILYNSTYLNRDLSELSLEILAHSKFKDGIRKGIGDNGIIVASKFGERKYYDVAQLHDVGIVYYDENPYLICIMTRGNDYEKLKLSLSGISEIVFQNIKTRFPAAE